MKLKLPLFKKSLKADFAIIDSVFPQKKPFAFRNAEINEYLKLINDCAAIAMKPTDSGENDSSAYRLGIDRQTFLDNKNGYSQYYPNNAKHVHYQGDYKQFDIGLAYSFFLAETYLLLPFYKLHNIPFVFVLYPGGRFGLNSKKSDFMLQKIFESDQFRAVIVTQKITENYLLSKKLCDQSQIEYIYGGFVQFRKEEILKRKYFGAEKPVLDICFVGAKYSDRGVDKGYDVFIDFAKTYSQLHKNVQFHVIGGFDKNDIDTATLSGRIRFYGYLTPERLKNMYANVDILISPNRPNGLFPGNFDGFPIGIDASYCGTALFVADELNMNIMYENGQELVVIKPTVRDVLTKIEEYYANPNHLVNLAKRGQAKTQMLFDINFQVDRRIRVFNKHALLKLNVK